MLPLVFKPYLRPQIWGGRALGERFGKRLPVAAQTYGESWEVSGHPHHPSRIAEGEFAGRSLPELFIERSTEILGRPARLDHFPLLVKLLDCQKTLSVQVHPDDFTAHEMLGEPNGKTEAWVVLESGPEAVIYAGFKPGVSRDELRQRLDDGTVAACLHSFRPKVGDCVFMPAGLVHAVGGGVVMAEVQQASDATFRLYDWNRVDPETGLTRKLHVDEALRAIHFDLAPGMPVVPTERESAPPGIRAEHLVGCPYFRLDRFTFSANGLVSTYLPLPGAECSIWMIVEGAAVLEGASHLRLFAKGETVLIPAACEPSTWRTPAKGEYAGPGSAQLLRIQIPR
jgi:mannose-6-phosphate isomerase